VSATLLDGAATAAQIREELKPRVQKLREAGIVPKLSVVLIGDDLASHTYVRMKAKRAEASVSSRNLHTACRHDAA
jgi:methylenetetrahydrofolate dehydrogenase (NADP+)/methenyltetrahydrofolate cyclohydrolase